MAETNDAELAHTRETISDGEEPVNKFFLAICAPLSFIMPPSTMENKCADEERATDYGGQIISCGPFFCVDFICWVTMGNNPTDNMKGMRKLKQKTKEGSCQPIMGGFLPIKRSYHLRCRHSGGGNSMKIPWFLHQKQWNRVMKGLFENRTHRCKRLGSGMKHWENMLQMCNGYLTTIPNAFSYHCNIKKPFSDWNWTAMLKTMV